MVIVEYGIVEVKYLYIGDKHMKNIIVFGGDGFCGWPTSLHLSKDYNIVIVDNLVRRKIDVELECKSLTPIQPISKRLATWKNLTDIDIRFEYMDVSDHYHRILSLFKEVKPKTVIHFAEQRSAPFSMKSPYHKRYTVNNNVNATNNILCAIVESGLDIHMIHLGCYDDKTEVLTESGWKLFKDLNENDKVATRTFEDRSIVYKKPKNILSYNYNGKMYEATGQRVNFCVTPNHRVMDVNKHKPGILREKYPKDIDGKISFFDAGFEWKGQEKDSFDIIGKKVDAISWMRFVGWYISEGGLTYKKGEQYRITIKQNKGDSDRILEEDIDAVAEQLELHVSKNKKNKCHIYSISNKKLAGFMKQFGRGSSKKFIPKKYRMLSSDLLKEMLDTLILGYGSIHGRGFRYFSCCEKLANHVQEVALKCGFTACVNNGESKTSYNGQANTVNISPTTRTSVDLKNYNNGNWIDYNGKVYCVEVGEDRYSVVFVRRNGKVLWSGNSTGVYGYGTAGMSIPEGYLRVKIETDNGIGDIEIPYPSHPGSIYHMTKTMDAEMFRYFNKNDDIRITDLHQGIVWGTQTEETRIHKDLINRFDWEGNFGTVLNRFLMQSQVGHPLTVHGSGGQTRAFINIQDTVKCIKIAVENPPVKEDKVKIFNQTTECLNIRELALKVASITGAEVRYYKNPRKEDDRNDLKFCNDEFMRLGLDPITLDNGLLKEIAEIASQYKHRCDVSKIICTSTWRDDITPDFEGNKKPQ